jgi:hypothetical protein
MMEAAEALRKIRRWAGLHSTGGLTDAEMANAFLITVMEAPLSATDECLAALPSTVRALTLEMLTEFALRDYYDDRHAYIMDGRTLEQRREHYRQMQPHYRAVGEYMLPRLRRESAAEPGAAPDRGGT